MILQLDWEGTGTRRSPPALCGDFGTLESAMDPSVYYEDALGGIGSSSECISIKSCIDKAEFVSHESSEALTYRLLMSSVP